MHKQKGFGIIPILITIVALAAIGFIGWRVYEAMKPNTNSTSSQGSQSANGQSQTTDNQKPLNKIFSSSMYNYTLAYPAGWTVSSAKQESTEVVTIKAPGTVTTDQPIGSYTTDKGAVVSMYVNGNCFEPKSCYASKVLQGKIQPGGATNKTTFILDDGTKADRYVFNGGEQVLETAFVKNGNDLVVDLATEGDELTSPYLQDYNDILRSIKFE